MSIKIIEVFVKMREMVLANKELLIQMDEIWRRIAGQDKTIQWIFDYLNQLVKQQEKPRTSIGFKQRRN